MNNKFVRIISLVLYYSIARFLPSNQIGKHCRYFCCKRIFTKCGLNVNIERKAYFGNGSGISIGDNSGIGINAHIPHDTIIGDNVMMGPNCYILMNNHEFSRIDVPMCKQGFTACKQTIIGNDVWIGRDVLMTPGRMIKSGSIVAAGTVLCKNFPEYSIIGGNPSRLIRSRK